MGPASLSSVSERLKCFLAPPSDSEQSGNGSGTRLGPGSRIHQVQKPTSPESIGFRTHLGSLGPRPNGILRSRTQMVSGVLGSRPMYPWSQKNYRSEKRFPDSGKACVLKQKVEIRGILYMSNFDSRTFLGKNPILRLFASKMSNSDSQLVFIPRGVIYKKFFHVDSPPIV